MDHWERVLPGKILRVQHEDVVEDLAGQVRRPINRDGLDQWRHYEPWLGPLKQALGGSVP